MMNIFDPDDILICCFVKGFVAGATLFYLFYLFQFHTVIITFIFLSFYFINRYLTAT
jgi:hypothetical protein